MTTPDIIEGLNPRQREAVETVSGPLLIIAGPGSGKTRVITHRVAYLYKVCGVSPYRIAALTFTNKAARELRARVELLMGQAARDLTVGTFHAFCAKILRRDGDQLGLDTNFVIYDDADQVAAIKRAMTEVNVDPKQFSPRSVQSAISSAKSQIIGVEGFGTKRENYFDEIVHRVYERYENLLSLASAVDFDDLLLKTYVLFHHFPEVAAKYQDRYVHFMIDEFQDTNVAQYAIAKQLVERHKNLCVVGDPDQSIYTWRNADIRNILSFQQDFPDRCLVALEENYRSTQTILDAARDLISSNDNRVEKKLFTSNGRGVPIVVTEGYNEQDEAKLVMGEIERLTYQEGFLRRDIAIMYRLNAQSRALEESCLRYGIRYQLVGNLRFYQRQEVKDLTAYLRLIANPNDDVSFARVVNVPARGIGQRTMDELARAARDSGRSMFATIGSLSSTDGVPSSIRLQARSVAALSRFREMVEALREASQETNLVDLMDQILEKSGYKDHVLREEERGVERLENLEEYLNSARDFVEMGASDTLGEFLENVSLVSDTDTLDEKTDAITLITLHQAKGLEYRVVFIVGMEEGILPHIRSMDNPAQMEEERRLCYVGITRAKDRLYLLRAFRRGFRGGSEPAIPSRFLGDIPRELTTSMVRDTTTHQVPLGQVHVKRTASDGMTKTDVAHKERGEKPSLVTGDKVKHAIFGTGVVVETKPSMGDLEVTVAFLDGHGVKRLLLSFAPLEKLG